MDDVRNESGDPGTDPPAAEDRPQAVGSPVVLPYRGRPDGRGRRSSSDLFSGVTAVLVLATSLTALIGTQLAALSGWLGERRELYALVTVLSLVLVYWSYRVARYYFHGTR